ncbi:ISAs1 family transposase [Rhodococcus koreensis]|uniref:ISAs1 family transposase n=1 Tax=Rhodococcus koreensis TaxID=99653 RepID=UPI0036DD4A61
MDVSAHHGDRWQADQRRRREDPTRSESHLGSSHAPGWPRSITTRVWRSGHVQVSAKTNEIPLLNDLFDPLAIADALHCHRGTAEYILNRGDHYAFPAKANQSTLLARLNALPWKTIPVSTSIAERGHGRLECRTIKTTEHASGLGFPGAAQALQVRRTVTRRGRKSVEVVYPICSLPMTAVDPQPVAAWVRRHPVVENRLHQVRDVTFDEDRCTIRTGDGNSPMPPSDCFGWPATPATPASPPRCASTAETHTARSNCLCPSDASVHLTWAYASLPKSREALPHNSSQSVTVGWFRCRTLEIDPRIVFSDILRNMISLQRMGE